MRRSRRTRECGSHTRTDAPIHRTTFEERPTQVVMKRRWGAREGKVRKEEGAAQAPHVDHFRDSTSSSLLCPSPSFLPPLPSFLQRAPKARPASSSSDATGVRRRHHLRCVGPPPATTKTREAARGPAHRHANVRKHTMRRKARATCGIEAKRVRRTAAKGGQRGGRA